ncbi:MAG: type II toxin-antitoxin system VapC family toxin [Terracidiphilus sp.]|jgi:predicted nucleic acid-binding protein
MQVLFDSSVYIGAFRGHRDAGLILERWRGEAPIWVSSVVLEELYAGADASGLRLIEKLERDFERARRVLVPSMSDWMQAGRLLAKIGAKYGFERIRHGRLTNDALIAASAARCGITLLTANARDFARLAEFCPLDWRVG